MSDPDLLAAADALRAQVADLCARVGTAPAYRPPDCPYSDRTDPTGRWVEWHVPTPLTGWGHRALTVRAGVTGDGDRGVFLVDGHGDMTQLKPEVLLALVENLMAAHWHMHDEVAAQRSRKGPR